MNEMNLIPEDYQQRLWKIEWTKRFGWFLGIWVALLIGIYLLLRLWVGALAGNVAELETKKSKWVEQANHFQQLAEEQKKLKHFQDLLGQLHQGQASERLFVTLDNALEGEAIWFLRLDFNSEIKSQENQWTVKHAMTVKGQATDHAALARFIKRLLEQPPVSNVTLNQTASGQGTAKPSLDFELGLIFRSS